MIFVLGQLGGMFTAPALAGAGLAAVSVPIAIHLLWRLRRRPRTWGAMRFLEAAYRRHKQRLRFEQMLLLLVRCLILAILGFALAGPMLTGAAAQWITGLDAGGRVVHVLIDDALPTRAIDAAGERRFDRLRERALDVVDALAPGDAVALWRSARPAGPLIAEPTQDHAVLREAIENLQPRYSRPDAIAALRQIEAALSETNVPGGRAKLIVLDSFSESATHLGEPPPVALRDLGERAALWASAPAPDAANVQIQQVRPQRHMVLAGEDRVEVGVRVTLRRFDRDLAPAETPLTVSLRRGDGRALTDVQRDHRFAAGERSSTFHLTLATSASELDLDGGAQMLVVEARLDGASLDNQLPADDLRWAIVELRSHLNVALVDEPALHDEPRQGLRPAQWLALALDPDEDGATSGVHLQHVSPGDVSEATLRELDAVMVLRPDALSGGAWRRLAAFADEGGMVWVFTPPLEVPATWARELVEAFDLTWRVGLEAVTTTDERGAPLDGDVPAPAVLAMLASDFADLVRPVRVTRRVPLEAPEEATWLRLGASPTQAPDQGQAEGRGRVILAAEPYGAGAVLLQATALDTDWTSLPTRPLFVPLMHEALRGVLGAARDRIAADVVAGDEPTFGPAWRHAARIEQIIAHDQANESDQRPTIELRRADQAVSAPRPLASPGVYRSAGERGALKLAVNVDADAGDVRSVTEQRVLTWLEELGGGALLDEHDLATMFERDAAVVSLGWPLLWLVGALVLLETLLNRWLSHAHQPDPRGFASRARSAVRYLRYGPGTPATPTDHASEQERAA